MRIANNRFLTKEDEPKNRQVSKGRRQGRLGVVMDLETSPRLAHRHQLETVDVNVRRQARDPAHHAGDVFDGQGVRPLVKGNVYGATKAFVRQFSLGAPTAARCSPPCRATLGNMIVDS